MLSAPSSLGGRSVIFLSLHGALRCMRLTSATKLGRYDGYSPVDFGQKAVVFGHSSPNDRCQFRTASVVNALLNR